MAELLDHPLNPCGCYFPGPLPNEADGQSRSDSPGIVNGWLSPKCHYRPVKTGETG